MARTAEAGGNGATRYPLQLLVVEAGNVHPAAIAQPLEHLGYRVSQSCVVAEAIQILKQERPALVIVDDGASDIERAKWESLRETARGLRIPVLDVVEDSIVPAALLDRHGEADDWVYRGRAPMELPARVATLLRGRRGRTASPSSGHAPLDSRFFALVIHDLRTPLNVVGLSLRMIEQALPKGNSELLDDVKLVEENFKQIDRMLAQLGDYYRLFENESPLSVFEFSPRRLLSELLENRVVKSGRPVVPVRLHVEETCPESVVLDQTRARLALLYVLANATASACDGPVRVTLRGEPDRWVTEVGIDRPPPATVKSVELRSDAFERLCGMASERRGMDLAIAARISELFGGTARLDAVAGVGTTVVLNWPVRYATM